MQTQTWYQVIAGILAIPVAIVTFFYSILLIKKGRLEAQKLELEIREKQQLLDKLPSPETVNLDPHVQTLFLRFMGFVVLSSLWGFATYLMGEFSHTLSLSYQLGIGSAWISGVGIILHTAIMYCFATTLLILGWPLFADINKHLGINISYLLKPYSSLLKKK